MCPIIPISGVSIDECIEYSLKLGKRVGQDLKIPVFLYEKSARQPSRKNLATIREGEYEGLNKKLKDARWKPDWVFWIG